MLIGQDALKAVRGCKFRVAVPGALPVCAGDACTGWLLAKLLMLLFPMAIPEARSGLFFMALIVCSVMFFRKIHCV